MSIDDLSGKTLHAGLLEDAAIARPMAIRTHPCAETTDPAEQRHWSSRASWEAKKLSFLGWKRRHREIFIDNFFGELSVPQRNPM
jgi:hypothetical protein